MTEYKRDFETVCAYAELKYDRRTGRSRAKNMAGFFFTNPWANDNKQHMVLFEGEKRIARGRTEPEVYWIVIDETGRVRRMPARNIRQMTPIPGFTFIPGVWEAMFDVLEWAEDRNYGKKNKG